MTLAPGQQIGTYTIERQLGAGGMGVVYIAIDTRLGRRAAIKQLLPAYSGDHDIVERFFNEAKAAASINHPSIVEIYDVGWHTDGSAYFAMKLLEGESLGRRMRGVRQLPIEIAATIARQVATALAAAHARGIVHRDLKPDNIMLVRDDEVVIGERAIVLDFGIAKLFDDGSAQSKTRTGTFMGTPAYMSPEQCRGAGDVDARTDVYALGCIVFEMLTGRPPFIAQGGGEIVGMHQFVAPPELRGLRSDVPPQLDALVMHALAKEPTQRVASMTDFAMRLSPFAVQALHTQSPAPGATQLSVPPAVASTYASGRGEVASRAPAKVRLWSMLFALVGVVSLTVTAVLLARGKEKPAEPTVTAPITGDAAIGDKRAKLRAATLKAMAERNWVDAQIAAQKWVDAEPSDAEPAAALQRALDEAIAGRAHEDLAAALGNRDHIAGLAAFQRIPTKSVYRDTAIELMGKLRADYITKKAPLAKQLAAEGRCKELGELQIEANQFGQDAHAAVSAGLQCVEVKKN